MSHSTTLAPTPDFLKLLAHDIRWGVLAALAHSDRKVQELVELLGQPANLVSYHLKRLRAVQLVRERRSTADARAVYYTLDVERVRQLYLAAGAELHPALASSASARDARQGARVHKSARVLFLCTENSARSQMAEGWLRALAGNLVEVQSAGNTPTQVHPLAIRTMAEVGIDISGQRAKHLDEFQGQRFDYSVTVCDRMREACPTLPGEPEQIHWSLADPAAVTGSQAVRYRAFKQTAQELGTRVRYLLAALERQHTPEQ